MKQADVRERTYFVQRKFINIKRYDDVRVRSGMRHSSLCKVCEWRYFSAFRPQLWQQHGFAACTKASHCMGILQWLWSILRHNCVSDTVVKRRRFIDDYSSDGWGTTWILACGDYLFDVSTFKISAKEFVHLEPFDSMLEVSFISLNVTPVTYDKRTKNRIMLLPP